MRGRYDGRRMKTTVEREGPTKLTLKIEVGPDEIKPLYEQTLKRLAREVSVPGFRKGKVPTAILESRLGPDEIKQEVLRDAVPTLFTQAARAEDVRPITLPEIEVTEFERSGPLHFTATIEVRPQITLPEYRGIEVTRPGAEPTDEEIDAQLDRLRDSYASLETVSRNATKEDYVSIDLNAYQHDVQIEEATAKDLLYEVGSGSFVPQLDAELEGKRAGDIFKFNAVLPERFEGYGGQEVSFSVIVKEVQAKRLPALDDEFAKTASEFDTLDQLREEIRSRVRVMKEAQAEAELRGSVLEDLIDRCDVPLPEAMVAAETRTRLNRLGRDLERAQLSLEQYLSATETTEEQLLDSYRKAVERAVAAQLVLEAVASAEGISVSEEEISEEIQRLARQLNMPEEKFRKELEESDRVGILADDILRRKTLDFLVEQAKVTEGSDGGRTS